MERVGESMLEDAIIRPAEEESDAEYSGADFGGVKISIRNRHVAENVGSASPAG